MIQTANALMEKLTYFINQGLNFSILTLTIRDGKNLTSLVNKLYSSFKSLKDNSSTKKIFKNRILGGMKALEIKIGKNSGEWHPHLHLILVHPKEFQKDYEWIQPAWKRITNNEGSIHIKKIKKRKNQTLGIYGALLEVSKYLSSPDKQTLEIDNTLFKELYDTLYKRRSKDTFGLLRGTLKHLDDNLDNEKEKGIIDFACRLCQCTEYELIEMLTNSIITKKITLYD
jgi:hypothetical protein